MKVVTITRTECDTIRGALLLLFALSVIFAAGQLWDAFHAEDWDAVWHTCMGVGAAWLAAGVHSSRVTLKKARAAWREASPA